MAGSAALRRCPGSVGGRDRHRGRRIRENPGAVAARARVDGCDVLRRGTRPVGVDDGPRGGRDRLRSRGFEGRCRPRLAGVAAVRPAGGDSLADERSGRPGRFPRRVGPRRCPRGGRGAVGGESGGVPDVPVHADDAGRPAVRGDHLGRRGPRGSGAHRRGDVGGSRGRRRLPPLPGARPDLSGAVPAVEFNGVVFAHDDAEQHPTPNRPVLDGVSFVADAGRTTALVGPSGAGKSTILALIERLHDPRRGVVRVGGADVRDLDRSNLRRHIAYVEQSVPVLAGTIRANLTLGLADVSDDRCRNALASVRLLDRIEAHGDGLDATLGDRGIGLSGGERQRLSIARALLSDRPLLLLDEPTASLDSRNERALQAAIDTASRSRTVIIVAHRLATVAGADRIVVVDEGRVRATGTHRELMESSDLYRDLARDQLLR
ncbi:ABC transporter ATP-binding protein [Corynebacterium xerosis]|nr:ABC transporter ATP-binding protein [Corynebacterium xerosis]